MKEEQKQNELGKVCKGHTRKRKPERCSADDACDLSPKYW